MRGSNWKYKNNISLCHIIHIKYTFEVNTLTILDFHTLHKNFSINILITILPFKKHNRRN